MPGQLKNRWSLGHNYLAGITAGAWWRLLRENGFAVDPAYWHRAAAFLWFLRKLTVKNPRPLVLKSPPHTARVRLLLEMFPEARFVLIHRDPYTVFQSFQHYYDTAGWYTYLQRPDLDGLDDLILRRYTVMVDAYLAEKALIPDGHFAMTEAMLITAMVIRRFRLRLAPGRAVVPLPGITLRARDGVWMTLDSPERPR